ncbi:oxytocin receptor-like [Dermacentor andersoni]|uniref:oxytocin receptor-like n=1 Tax=Dermacentor andersoni TaxID=34620 RepID=UPI003B3B81A5
MEQRVVDHESGAYSEGVPSTPASPPLVDDVSANSTAIWASSRDESLAHIEIAVLALIFAFTVAGNGCVLAALAARRCKLTRMYYFLLHLCISDLTTAFFTVLPQLGWDATYRFRGGDVACKSVKFVQLLGPYLSSYVLVVTAVDRYQAICFPLSSCSWTPRKSKILVSVAWAVSLLCCVPQVFIFSYQEVSAGVYDCWGTFIEPWGLRAYVTWYGVSVFFVPLLVLCFTYVCICHSIWRNLRQKRESSKAADGAATATVVVDGSTRAVRRAFRLKGAAANRDSAVAPFMAPRSHSVRGLSRAKIKTVKITVVVIVLYIACSSPFICVQMWMYWSPYANIADPWTNATVTILMLLNSLNSCVNPWIYLFFNRNLLQALRSRVCRQCSSHKGTDSSAASSLVTAPCSRPASTSKSTSSKHVTFLRSHTTRSVGRKV